VILATPSTDMHDHDTTRRSWDMATRNHNAHNPWRGRKGSG
jgi:hypothetical protein